MADSLKPERNVAPVRLQDLLETEHWLGNYISVLLSCWELTGDVDFETAGQLLETERKEFQQDLQVARRMYNLYPALVAQSGNGGAEISAPSAPADPEPAPKVN